jgi:hypothetical protein
MWLKDQLKTSNISTPFSDALPEKIIQILSKIRLFW